MEITVDNLIIGGGISGHIAARELIRKYGRESVLIIESGKKPANASGSGAAFYSHQHLPDITSTHPFNVVWTIADWQGSVEKAKEAYASKIYHSRKHPVSLNQKIDQGYKIDIDKLTLNNPVIYNTVAKSILLNPQRTKHVVTNRGIIRVLNHIVITVPLPIWIPWIFPVESAVIKMFKHATIKLWNGNGCEYFGGNDRIADDTMYIRYFPSGSSNAYRSTVTNSGCVIESVTESLTIKGVNQTACPLIATKWPGKIFEPSDKTKELIQQWMTICSENQVWPVGRYAKWIPKYFIHDAYFDSEKITKGEWYEK